MKKFRKNQGKQVLLANDSSIEICKLDSFGYVVDTFDFLVYFRRQDCFKKLALRQAILIFNPKATFKTNSNLKALNHVEVSNNKYIGKHFFKSGLASKLKNAGVKYDIV